MDADGDGRVARRIVARGVPYVLASAVAALAVTCALLVTGARADSAEEAARADVLAAARQHAVNLTSQDHRTVDADLARMLDGATGQLRADLAERRDQTKQVVLRNKAVAKGAAVDAGLVALRGDAATVIVAVDSTVSSAGIESPVTRRYRFQLDLSRVGDRWLVSNLTAVGLAA